MIKRIPVIITLLSGILIAQNTNPTLFVARTGAISLSTAGTTATIQAAPTNAEQIQITNVIVSCSVACTVTITQNSTGVTSGSGTAGSIIGINPYNASVFTTTFWTGVTLTGGTVLTATPCSAACTVVYSIPWAMGTTGVNTNLSATISSITGTAYIDFQGKRL